MEFVSVNQPIIVSMEFVKDAKTIHSSMLTLVSVELLANRMNPIILTLKSVIVLLDFSK